MPNNFIYTFQVVILIKVKVDSFLTVFSALETITCRRLVWRDQKDCGASAAI